MCFRHRLIMEDQNRVCSTDVLCISLSSWCYHVFLARWKNWLHPIIYHQLRSRWPQITNMSPTCHQKVTNLKRWAIKFSWEHSMHSRRRNELGNPDLITQTLAPSFYEIIIFWTIKETSSELQIHIQDLEIKKQSKRKKKMKTFGLLALGGAMGLQFEDLTYDNLRGAFSKVKSRLQE